MSWDSYIDNLIAQTKDSNGAASADKACIIGIDGGASWTTAGHANALKVGVGYLIALEVLQIPCHEKSNLTRDFQV